MLGSLLQNVFNALQWGSYYSIIALGYCLVYGVLRFINFSHGDIFMIASYTAFFIATVFLSLWPGGGVLVFIITVILTMAITALLGVSIERIAYRPLRRK